MHRHGMSVQVISQGLQQMVCWRPCLAYTLPFRAEGHSARHLGARSTLCVKSHLDNSIMSLSWTVKSAMAAVALVLLLAGMLCLYPCGARSVQHALARLSVLFACTAIMSLLHDKRLGDVPATVSQICDRGNLDTCECLSAT